MTNFFYEKKLTAEGLEFKEKMDKKLFFLRKVINYSWLLVLLTVIFAIFDRNKSGEFFRYAGIVSFVLFFFIHTIFCTLREFLREKFWWLANYSAEHRKSGLSSADGPILFFLSILFIRYFFVDTRTEIYIGSAIILAIYFPLCYVVKVIAARKYGKIGENEEEEKGSVVEEDDDED